MRTARRTTPAALLLTLAAACGTEQGTGPAPPAFDVAQAFSGVAATATTALVSLPTGSGTVASAFRGPLPAELTGCAWDAAARAFVCAPSTAGGLTVTHAYTPLDAQGVPQRVPDRATTAAARVVTTTDFTSTSPSSGAFPGATSTMTTRQDATVRGLLAPPRTLDATLVLETRFAPAGGQAVRVRLTQTTTGLVLPDGAARWPSAGTVTADVADPDTGRGTARMVMTFNGTSTADVLLTVGGVARRCTLDLASGASTSSSPLQCSAP